MVAVPGPPPTPRPPARALPRLAGAFTQLTCGACLLIGTIGFVLVQQNKSGGAAPIAAWLIMAMAGLVCGGLIYRGGLVSMLIAAAIDAGFGVALIAIEYDTLRTLLRILPASDVSMIGDALDVAGFVMIGAGAFCLVALPQGMRYARWFRDAAATRSAMSTARGFPPPPVPARTSAYIIPTEEHPASRRRLYMVLGGVAIGVGAGIGVLVSSTKTSTPDDSPRTAAATRRPESGTAPSPGTPATVEARTPGDAGSDDASAASAIRTSGGGAAAAEPSGAAVPVGTVDDLLAAQRVAMVNADGNAFAELLSATAFGFGIDAAEVAEGRDAVAAQLVHDLGEPPRGGFTVESRARTLGEQRGHAWISEEIELAAAGRDRRRLAITELAAVIDGKWRIVALHWATPIDDATAERSAILGTLPMPQPIADRHDGSDELDRAVRAAFASRAAFADARSERIDAFNYGSGGERAQGGAAIKRIFGKLKAQIRLHDGARVCAGSAWDTVQRSEPWIGWAAVNVDFTSKTRAATEVTQTFRVLAILIKEGSEWKLLQTQWSNGGPIR